MKFWHTLALSRFKLIIMQESTIDLYTYTNIRVGKVYNTTIIEIILLVIDISCFCNYILQMTRLLNISAFYINFSILTYNALCTMLNKFVHIFFYLILYICNICSIVNFIFNLIFADVLSNFLNANTTYA